MVKFVIRDTHPKTYQKPFDAIYWNVFDRSKRIGWFGIFNQDNKWYTDISVKEKFRGNGYFAQIYDYFFANHWDYAIKLYAFIGHNNKPSIRAHEKYGCKMIKHNKITDIYLVKARR